MCSWSSYTENFEKHSSIVHRLESAREQTVKSNRHYITSIAEVILLCAKQEFALRGHDESTESHNRGNFREILELVVSHDPILRERILRERMLNPQIATVALVYINIVALYHLIKMSLVESTGMQLFAGVHGVSTGISAEVLECGVSRVHNNIAILESVFSCSFVQSYT